MEYVCTAICQFFSVFFQQKKFIDYFNGRLGKKQKNVSFYGVCMYVCKAKTDICQFFFCFFCPPFPNVNLKKNSRYICFGSIQTKNINTFCTNKTSAFQAKSNRQWPL